MMKQDEFEKIFKKYVRLKGYTQGRLARELQVHPSTINKWIKGINAIPYETVGKLCGLLALEGKEKEELFNAAGYPLPLTRRGTSSPMVEDLPPGYVPRPQEFKALKDSLLREGSNRLTAMTSALKGAGGYGKTTLAQALCHDPDIKKAFPDGIEWVTLGEAPSTGNLVAKIKDVIYRYSTLMMFSRIARFIQMDTIWWLPQKMGCIFCVSYNMLTRREHIACLPLFSLLKYYVTLT